MAQDTATTAVLTHSVLATARIFVVLLAGFLASKWPKHEPLLTREACRCVSRVCALLFQPALVISSTGGTLSFADLQDSWQLVVAGGLTVGLSVAVAWVSARLLLGPESRRAFRPVELAIAFQNCAFIPLLLMESLCEQDVIKSDFGDDADECFSQATSMIFLYYASWQVCFYTWGFYALGQDDALELKLTAQLARTPPTIDDASSTRSRFEHSPRVSEVGGTLSDGSSSSSSSSTAEETGDTLSNDSSSTSSIADGTIYTLSNDSSSSSNSNSAKGGGRNGMVAVDVHQLNMAPVPAAAPPRGLLSACGMVAADVDIASVFITPAPRLKASGTVPVDVTLGITALVAAPSSLRACHRSLTNGIKVAPDVPLDAAALVSPPPPVLRANGMVTGDVLRLGNALVAPPSPRLGGLRACDRNNLAKEVGHAQGGGGGRGGSGGAEHVSDAQQKVLAVDGVNGEPSSFQVSSPQGGLRACDRNLAKGSGYAQGGGGGGGSSGGGEYVSNVQQQVATAVDYDNGESSRFQISPPPEGLRACDRNLAKEGGHAQSGGGGGGYENDMGVRQVVAVDSADREPSRLQGDIVVPPSAEEVTPQEWSSRDPESLVTAASCRRNSMQQRTTSREDITTALGTAKAMASLGRRVRSPAVGQLATASCRWDSKQRQTSSSEEHDVSLDAAERQRTTAADKEQNVALSTTTAPKQHQRTTTGEESVALQAVHKEALGYSSGDGGAWVKVWWRRIWIVLVSPNIIAVTIGITIAMISPLQDVLFSDPQAVLRPLGAALKTLGTPTVATSLLVMAGSLTQVPVVGAGGEQPGGNGDGTPWNWRRFNFIAGALLVACRLVMVPAIGFGIFWVASEHSTMLGENRVMRMIMLIELAMPSGAFIIVSLNQLEMPATAGFMARLYLWQHGASILTITLWTALAVYMVY